MRTKKPTTIDGIPASTSIAGLIQPRARGGANSAVYNAAASPSGVANNMAMRVILSVPMMRGRMLYFGTPEIGCQVYGDWNGLLIDAPSTVRHRSGAASRAT